MGKKKIRGCQVAKRMKVSEIMSTRLVDMKAVASATVPPLPDWPSYDSPCIGQFWELLYADAQMQADIVAAGNALAQLQSSIQNRADKLDQYNACMTGT